MASIEGVSVNAQSISNCYKMFYPQTSYPQILDENLFHYLHLWGIRVSACDTSLPDDLIGGLRINNFNFLESLIAKGSTEPSPKSLISLYDAEAKARGGAAFVMEGQYLYKYMGSNHGNFKPYPSFCPIEPVKVYGWKASEADIKAWDGGKGRPLSALFEQAVKEGKVKLSTSSDTCIHRTWSSKKLWNDSAGCQVIADEGTLKELGVWAVDHQKKGYGKTFTYTLFTKEQFLKANKKLPYGNLYGVKGQTSSSPIQDTPSIISNIIKNIFGTK